MSNKLLIAEQKTSLTHDLISNLNLGPQHSLANGVLRLIIESTREKITSHIGYLSCLAGEKPSGK